MRVKRKHGLLFRFFSPSTVLMNTQKMIEYENLAKVNKPFFSEYLAAFEKTIQKGSYILGKNVISFESEYSNYTGTKHTIAVASGLDALILHILS